MAELKSNRVATVEILGSEYRLTGDDESHMKRLAQFVDNKLRECSENGMVYSSGRLGILTCLNIADQLFKVKNEQLELTNQTLDFVKKSIGKIDKILDCVSQKNEIDKIELTEAIYAKN